MIEGKWCLISLISIDFCKTKRGVNVNVEWRSVSYNIAKTRVKKKYEKGVDKTDEEECVTYSVGG